MFVVLMMMIHIFYDDLDPKKETSVNETLVIHKIMNFLKPVNIRNRCKDKKVSTIKENDCLYGF